MVTDQSLVFKVYLAGGLASDWQHQIISASSNIEFLDPRTWQHPSPAVYTERDLAAIRMSDAVFAFMSSANPSGYGMSLEIGYAHALKKPIIFCDLLKEDWRRKYFGMAKVCATYFYEDVDLAIECLKKLGETRR